MNLDSIESLLVPPFQRLFRGKVDVFQGPAAPPALGGMRPALHVHASRFEDFGGVTDDGAHIARRPAKEGRFRGFAEERPGRIVVEISCLATRYATVQEICATVSPLALRTLESKETFALGELANRSVRLSFADFTAHLSRAEFERKQEKDFALHCGRLEFHLNGFLHAWVTNRGGLRPRPQ